MRFNGKFSGGSLGTSNKLCGINCYECGIYCYILGKVDNREGPHNKEILTFYGKVHADY